MDDYVAATLRPDFPDSLGYVCMLAAYFDESGTHEGSQAVAVAGYIAHADQWAVFDRQWKEALADFKRPYFHMTDYAGNRQGYRWGTKRPHRFNRLMSIINRNVEIGIGVVLDVDAWNHHVQTKEEKRYFGTSKYDFCATVVLGLVALWCDDKGIHEGIAYTYEQGANGWREFHETYKKEYANAHNRQYYRLLGDVSFRDKKRFTPLQAADIVAFQMHKERPRQRGIDLSPSRADEVVRLVGVPAYWPYFDDAAFIDAKKRITSDTEAYALFQHGRPKTKKRKVSR